MLVRKKETHHRNIEQIINDYIFVKVQIKQLEKKLKKDYADFHFFKFLLYNFVIKKKT